LAIFKALAVLWGLNPCEEFAIMFSVGYLHKEESRAAFFKREKETKKW